MLIIHLVFIIRILFIHIGTVLPTLLQAMSIYNLPKEPRKAYTLLVLIPHALRD